MKLQTILLIVAALTGCTTHTTQEVTLPLQQAQTTEASSTTPDEASSFSNEDENDRAEARIEEAEIAYKEVSATISQFLSTAPVNCNSPQMTNAPQTLQSIDESAKRYLELATTAPDMGDREAAADVLDSLNGIVLDGLVDLVKAYRTKGCLPWAKQLIQETKRVYSGDAYQGWISALNSELQLIEAAQRSAQTKPKHSVKRATQ